MIPKEEKDTKLNADTEIIMPKVRINTTMKMDLIKLTKENSISYADALDLGAQILLADEHIIDYPDCELYIKMMRYKALGAKVVQELNELKEDIEKIKDFDKKIEEYNQNNIQNDTEKTRAN